MLKDVEDWLKQLPSYYKHRAIEYHSTYNKLGKCNSLANALVLAFKWSSSREGAKYWKAVHKMCEDGVFVDINKRRYVKQDKIKEKSIAKQKVIRINNITGLPYYIDEFD